MAVNTLNRPLDVLEYVYPIGAIYTSTDATAPEVLFGFGTWEKLSGKFLYAEEEEEGGIEAGTTGGAKTHTLITNELPSHNHTFSGSSVSTGNQSAGHTHTYTDYYATTTGNCAISVAQMPSHGHSTSMAYAINARGNDAWYNRTMWGGPADVCYNSVTVNGNGSTNNHNHSGANTSSTRTSNGISANHNHTVTAAGSIGNTGGGSAFSTMPPYLAVHMWKRVA